VSRYAAARLAVVDAAIEACSVELSRDASGVAPGECEFGGELVAARHPPYGGGAVTCRPGAVGPATF
jgi:hypothetical protein